MTTRAPKVKRTAKKDPTARIAPVFQPSLWIQTMNRCTLRSPFTRPLRIAFALTALLFAASTWAQLGLRPFPPKTQRAVMQITQPPELLLNGAVERLSPGARIHGRDNLIVMSGTLADARFLVNYVRESSGQIYEVWILTDAEAAQALPVSP